MPAEVDVGGGSRTTGARVAHVDDLKAVLVAWIIGCHALMAYTRVGGWPWDEVQETTLAPRAELAVCVALGPTGLFVIGTFFFLAGLFAPAAIRGGGAAVFVRRRLVRLGVPWVLGVLVVWPTLMWWARRSAGFDWSWREAFVRRTPFLDSGPLWFLQVLLYVSLGYALWWARLRRGRPRLVVGRGHLLVATGAIAAVSYGVSIWFPARSQQVLDLHVWQWPQCVGMFVLGVLAGDAGWAGRIPSDLVRVCRVAVVAALGAAGVAALLTGLSDVARDGTPYLGGGTWRSAVLAVLEAVLVVGGSVWLLAVAQRRGPGGAPWLRPWRRGAFAAYLLQAPVLIAVEVALRPLAVGAGVKAVVVAVVAVLTSFGLGTLLVPRHRSGRTLLQGPGGSVKDENALGPAAKSRPDALPSRGTEVL